MQNVSDIDAIMAISPVIPVIRVDEPKHVLPLGEALLRGGVGVAEITLRTEHGIDAIKRLRQELPTLIVGAGTVQRADDVTACVNAGAQFLVSPGLTQGIGDASKAAGLPLLPGVATASECLAAMEQGFSRLKFFPASVSGGVPWLGAIGAALGELRFCPTGGVTPANAADYLALENVSCVGGSWLTPSGAIDSGDFDKVVSLCRDAITTHA